MLRLASMIGLLMAIGCSSKDDDATDTGTAGGGGGTDECGTPQATADFDEVDFYVRGTVDFKFTKDKDEEATVSLADASGAAVTGKNEWVGDTIRFTPDAPLTTGSAYEATLTHCGGVADFSFRPGDLGGALEDGPASLTGRTYAVALGEARFVKPEGVGSARRPARKACLIGVTAADEAEISMMGALSVEGSLDQDRCEPSIEFPVAADFTEAPFFSINADELALSVSDFNVGIKDFTLSGTFAADGSYMGGAVLAGLLDARDLVEALIGGGILEDGSDATAVCDLISAFSVNCEACSDGEEYCLSIHVDESWLTRPAPSLWLRTSATLRPVQKAATSNRCTSQMRNAGPRVGVFLCSRAFSWTYPRSTARTR